ncbi:MAG: hypothetical protein K6V97_07595 [Actinomycetia bacterium]|nr:hypothetical protein [Actinomycetes bacterium]
MEIVNPAFGRPEPPTVIAAASAGPRGSAIAALSNNKPHAWELLEGVRRQVPWVAERPWRYAQKDRPAMPASADVLDAVAQDAGIAVVALAD